MRSRGLVVVLALVLATLATVGVFLYSQGVKEDARTGGDLMSVIVSKVDIQVNSDLNPLLDQGQFTTLDVPQDAVVEGAITDAAQLRDRKNNAFILAGEQIPISRVEGGLAPGGVIGIPDGHQAMTVALDAPRAIAGALTGGDNVTIYATFTDVEVVQVDKNFVAVPVAGERPSFDTTVVLAPEVEVLSVIRPRVTSTTIGGGDEGSEAQGQAAEGNISVTMAFLPEEAQRFVFALEQGTVYLSLLPPGQTGVDLDPLTVAQVLLPQKQK